jgi:hypothetical protein
MQDKIKINIEIAKTITAQLRDVGSNVSLELADVVEQVIENTKKLLLS